MSGQGEEEPLELGAVGVGGTISVERALLQAGRDDLEAGPVECPGRRRELRHHIGAVAPLLDHLDHAADLALSPLQPPDHAGHRLAVCFHANSLKAGARPQGPAVVPSDFQHTLGGISAVWTAALPTAGPEPMANQVTRAIIAGRPRA